METLSASPSVLPRSYRVLRSAQLATCFLAGIGSLVIFIVGIGALADDSAGARANAPWGLYLLLVSFVGLGLLAIRITATVQMFRGKPSFLFFTRLYAYLSLGSKIVLFFIGLVATAMVRNASEIMLAESDVFTQMLGGSAYRSSVDNLILQLNLTVFVFLSISALYPAFVLLLSYRPSMKEYVGRLG